MNKMLSNPDRENFMWRVISEISKSSEDSQRLIPVEYFEKLMTRKVLWSGDIKILLDSMEIAFKKWDFSVVGLIRDLVENEYAYLLNNIKK